MEWITLEGGAEIYFSENIKLGKCKSCDADFLWGITQNQRWIQVVKDESGKYVPHLVHCPGAGKHRK